MIKTFSEKLFRPVVPYRNFIFVPLFFAFYIVLAIFDEATFPLHHFEGRSISLATYFGVDVGERISTFYTGISLAIILFVGIALVAGNFLSRVKPVQIQLLNGICFGGFSLLFFSLTGADMHESLGVIGALSLLWLLTVIVPTGREEDHLLAFTWSALLSLSLFFFAWQLSNFAGVHFPVSLPLCIVVGGFFFNLFAAHSSLSIDRICYLTVPLSLLPLLSFLSEEAYMILNQHEVFVSPVILYGIGLAIITAYCFSRTRKSNVTLDPSKLIFKRWIPLLLAGIICTALYKPVVSPEIDWFEDGNKILPLHQWINFGRLPFLDTFNSHVLADFAPGLLYSLFNGPDAMGLFVYSFIVTAAVVVLNYFLLYKVTGNGYFSLWFCLLYPYTSLLLPSYYNLVPLIALSLIALFEKQSVRRYTLLLFCILFIIIWRIDLGMSATVAAVITLLIFQIAAPEFSIDWKKFFKALRLPVIVLLVLLIMVLLHSGTSFFKSAGDAMNYLSSFQSYGLQSLSDAQDMKYYSLYFIMPACVIIILLVTIMNVHRQRYRAELRWLAVALIFFSVFYLSNIQRGLARHTLAEHWDTAFTSYGFFIIAASVFLHLRNFSPAFRYFIFYLIGSLIIFNYSYSSPDLKSNNYFSLLAPALKEKTAIHTGHSRIRRIEEKPEYKSRYEEFAEWMNTTFSDTATFLDFSNSPMMYYYTNREVPNYFMQVPHTAHNDYLQERLIEDLAKYDVPVVIFSNSPETFWDNLDGIPNQLRHYKVAEYIFKNYKPAYVLSKHAIWTRRDIHDEIDSRLISTMSASSAQLKDVTLSEDSFLVTQDHAGLVILKNDSLPETLPQKLFGVAEVFSRSEITVATRFRRQPHPVNEGFISRTRLMKGNNIFFLPAERDSGRVPDEFIIEIPPFSAVKFSSLKFITAAKYPDLASVSPEEWSLNLIPFIWGEYDQNFIRKNIIGQQIFLDKEKLFPADNETTFEIREKYFSKMKGNYIFLSLKNEKHDDAEMHLSFGEPGKINGTVNFRMKPDTLYHNYLVRISAQYNWFARKNTWISFKPDKDIIVKNTGILKGD